MGQRMAELTRTRGTPPWHSHHELKPEESWPDGHPLPLPRWGRPRETFRVDSVEQYEELAATVELTVQQMIEAHNYNTVGNLVRFYEEFRSSGEGKVRTFFRRYRPPITPEHHTCVGLGLELLQRLRMLHRKFPDVAGKFYLVSCEESIDNFQSYVSADPSTATSEKEHVLVALKISIAGRNGILLLDPGYHVARVITVMADLTYPHTGWFTQSDEPHVRKEYSYAYAENSDYINWVDIETRNKMGRISQSLIYVAKPYLTPVHVTERRNLVYNFRSYLARDTKGHLVAGMYFPVKEGASCVVFFQDGTGKARVTIPLNATVRTPGEIHAVRTCGAQLGLAPGQLELLIDKVSAIISDKDFLRQMLDINREINVISQEN
ncbi:UNVERIFIED_CONTAM: hypothetical protein PYX00_003427 [Menopon gallinae]|uniref:Uncharacterized protein n=1 Tax=Menopon gallinae TaxID=328185 RepID=A0AAW2I0D7_9NEOP